MRVLSLIMIKVVFIVFLASQTANALIGGKKYNIGSYPHAVVLTSTRSGQETLMGGGSLITLTCIVSAAHHMFYEDSKTKKMIKYKPNEMYATVGIYDLLKPESGHIFGEPTEIIIHENYNADYNEQNKDFNADIALLKFPKGLFRLSPHIQPIPLLRDEIKSKTDVRRGIVAGCWGESNTTRADFQARYAVVKTRPKDQCFDEDSRKTKEATDLSHVFCAGEDNFGVCGGDSGSGLIIKVNDLYYLKGIVIGGIFDLRTRCTEKLNTLFTDVVRFIPWIDKNLEDLPKRKTTKKPKKVKIENPHDELRR